jgi:hypothetical protein
MRPGVGASSLTRRQEMMAVAMHTTTMSPWLPITPEQIAPSVISDHLSYLSQCASRA